MHQVRRRICDQIVRTGAVWLLLLATLAFTPASAADAAAESEPLDPLQETARPIGAAAGGGGDPGATRVCA